MGEPRERVELPLPGQVAARLREVLGDPRYLAQALIREQLGEEVRFLGKGVRGCPWLVFAGTADFYAFYLRDRELVQIVSGRPDEVVCAL